MKDKSIVAVTSIKKMYKLWDFAEMMFLTDFSCCKCLKYNSDTAEWLGFAASLIKWNSCQKV